MSDYDYFAGRFVALHDQLLEAKLKCQEYKYAIDLARIRVRYAGSPAAIEAFESAITESKRLSP